MFTCAREAVEPRLELHDRTACDLLAKIAKRCPPRTAARIRRVGEWLEEDRRRLIAHLFESTEYTPNASSPVRHEPPMYADPEL